MPEPINIEVRAQVEDAVRGLGTATSSFTDLKHANEDAAGALGVFGVSLTSLNNPLTLVASTIKDSIDYAAAYGESVQKLATESGQTAEAASTMATVFGDFGVQTDSLNRMVKQFTKEGLEFNLTTIERLSAQYNALPDALSRNEFAYSKFGMSAQNLNEILAAGPAKLQAMADQAQFTGKVLDGPALAALEDYRIKTKQLTDQLDGLKIELAVPVTNVLIASIDSFHRLAAIVQDSSIAVQAHTGHMTYQEAAIRANAAANGDLWAATDKLNTAESAQLTAELQVSDATDRHTVAVNTASVAVGLYDGRINEFAAAQVLGTAAQTAATTAAGANTLAMAAQTTAAANAATASESMAQSLSKLTNANLASAAIGQLGKDLAAGKISAQDYTTAADAIGLKFGLMTPAGIHAGEAITTLSSLLDSHRISPEQYAGAIDKIQAAAEKGPVTMAALGLANVDFGNTLDMMISGHLSPANLVMSDATPETAMASNLSALIRNGISPANRGFDDLAAKIAALPTQKTITIDVVYQTHGTPP